MPATDQIWRPLGAMHRVFAGSAFALLAATLVMMAFDQDREWRRYQAEAEEIRVQKLERDLAGVVDSSSYRRQLEELNQSVAAAQQALDAHAEEKARLEAELAELTGQVQLQERNVKFKNAEVGKARADLDIRVRDGLPTAEFQAIYDDLDAKAREMQLELEDVKARRDSVKNALAALTAQKDQAEAALANFKKDADRIREQIKLLRPTAEATGSDVGKMDRFASLKRQVKRWPIINGFNPEIKIIQDWIPDLKQQLGMAKVARFDRCRTCHIHIDRFATGNIPEFPHGTADEQKYPHPFSSHPRPDVYLTAISPHPLEQFGCTSCHEGDGSGTSFQAAEHTPDNPVQAHDWADAHHWHSNHFWEYPMHPQSFIESGCLKCHHNVIELGINEKYGPTAPKLFEGYNLIKDFGCFGCHEINGYDGPRPIGPDLRLEPQTLAEAEAIAADPNQVAGRQRKVGPSLRHLASKTTPEFVAYWTEAPQRFRPDTRMPQFFGLTNQTDPHTGMLDPLAAKLQPVELAGIAAFLMERSEPLETMQPLEGYTPDAERGKLLFSRRGCLACHSHDDPAFAGSKADFGPNLSKVHEKVRPGAEGFQWLYTWVRDPERHHARTRMPNLFLEPEGEGDNYVDPAADIAAFLLAGGPREFPALNLPGVYLGVVTEAISTSEQASAAGLPEPGGLVVREVLAGSAASRILAPVIVKGVESIQPGLRAGDVLQAAGGAPLTSPDQLAQLEAAAEPGTTVTLTLWRDRRNLEVEAVLATPLEDLTRLFLRKQMTAQDVDETLRRGIVSRRQGAVDGATTFIDVPAEQLKGDEIELVRQEGDPAALDRAERERRMLLYVGRRTVSRYGCFGCHDIAGFEAARPIGTALQDWGRKDTSKLAPEHIEEYLHHHGEPGGGSTHKRIEKAVNNIRDGVASHEDQMAAYFYDSLTHHGRAGFLWQKLRQPRSYDYEKTSTKGWDERLRMPQFPFSETQIEAVATFVLGLVADPPAEKYLYQPEGPALARIEGERLLEQYNCASCHVLDMPGFKYETDLRAFIGMTRTELVDWFVQNADAIESGAITQDTLAQRPAADGTAPSLDAVQPAEFQTPLQTFIRNCELLLDGQLADVEDVKTGLLPHLARLAKSAEARELNTWLDLHPETLLADPIPDADVPETVRMALDLKPPVRHGAAIHSIQGPETIEVHGLVYAEPDPEETDPEFREYAFDLWENLEVGGRYKLAGVSSRYVFPETSVKEVLPGRGGDFARWLVPQLKASETGGDQNKAWQAAPPPLYKEGLKVQTPWLYRFLKNPDRLRYTTVLRMPRFNMSDDEAQALANYFAAVDGAPYPYQRMRPQEPGYLAAKEAEFEAAYPADAESGYLGTAWKTLNAPLCIKCHSLGGRTYQGTDPTKDIRGPNLERVAQRLRPDWVRLWVYKPAAITSYTSMPSNFPRNQQQFPELFGGDPHQQTGAVVDALLNYYNLMEHYGETVFQPQAPVTPPAGEPPPM